VLRTGWAFRAQEKTWNSWQNAPNGLSKKTLSEEIVSEAQGTKSIGRSIGAVVAGVLVGIVLSLGTDTALRAAHIFPATSGALSDGLCTLATAYRTVYGILSCYVAARLAPRRPMKHALILGAIGLVVSLAGAIVTWNMEPPLGPHWYPIALVVLAMPQAWVGGALREMQLRKGQPT
jgi:hypothetical protein